MSLYRHLLLAAGWAALAFVIYRVSQLEAGSATYDPFAILGIRQVSRNSKRRIRHAGV
jgi:preprotein translocase subunit Sec63